MHSTLVTVCEAIADASYEDVYAEKPNTARLLRRPRLSGLKLARCVA